MPIFETNLRASIEKLRYSQKINWQKIKKNASKKKNQFKSGSLSFAEPCSF
jgi:hypothetical protein